MSCLEASRAFFDRLAREGAMETFGLHELAVVRRQLALWRIPAGASVLELGCGSGRLTSLLGERVEPGGRVVAMDLSLGMLARSQRRGAGSWLAAQGERLPFPEALFHRCICFQVVPHLADRAAAFAEAARVLVPGGLLWIAHTLSREGVNALHRSLGPPVDTHLLPETGVLLGEARAVGLVPFHVEDGPEGFQVGFVRR